MTANLEFSSDGGTTWVSTTADLVSGSAATLQVRVNDDSATPAVTSPALFEISTTSLAAGGGAATTTLDITLPGVSVADTESLFYARSDVQSSTQYDFQVGTGTSAEDVLTVDIQGTNAASLGLTDSTIATQDDANNAITQVASAIDALQSSRATVGASLSRLEFASSNLAVTIENSESAKSSL